MKNINKFIILIFLFGAMSCQDFVTEVEEIDPTQPVDAELELVVTAAEVGFIGFIEGDMARLGGIFTDQFSGADRQYIGYDDYIATSGDFDAPWANVYANVLKSIWIAQSKASEGNNRISFGHLQVLEAFTLGMTSALWGDVPYTEAYAGIANPAYESQAQIYSTVQSILDDAKADLNSGVGSIEGSTFGLSVAEWTEVANTLKAKFYLHTGDNVQAINWANQGISSPAGDLMANHGTSYTLDFNIWYSFLVYDRAGYMGAVNSLAANKLDPLGFFGPTGEYRGNAKTDEGLRYAYYYQPFEIYAPGGHEPNYFSTYDWGLGDGFFGTETSYPLLTYAENNLILAEAYIRENDPTNAITALNTHRAWLDGLSWYPASGTWNEAFGIGLTANYDPYVLADFAPTVGMENPDGIAQNDAIFREIIEEKYVTMTGTLEVFTDMRRPAYGGFSGSQNWEVVGVTANVGSTIPQRFLYPQNEVNSNTNTPVQSQSDLFTTIPLFE